MCGIAGFVRKSKKIEPNLIESMLACMEHRGPDDKGIFQDDKVSPFCTLGHRRLSIIDLKTGHQPLADESGDNCCVYNGEVYNFQELRKELEEKGYKFKTTSDTEVIVNAYHAYGKECVKKFNGMFAFGIWNNKKKTLFLARDRVGIKPLYYYEDNDSFLFSSSLKSFRKLDFIKKDIDMGTLSEYLQYLYINAPKTIYKTIKKLEPGTTLFYKDGRVTLEKYWNIQKTEKLVSKENDAIDKLREILSDSVKKRLISDVPLGVFLSGGVDSSIITALASKHSPNKIKTFSIAFKGKGYYDESKFAKKVSQLFETEHREEEVSPNLKNDLSNIVDFLDEPFADSSFLPTYYLSKFTTKHVKVALSGTGGDDIFAGYRRYAVSGAAKVFDNSPGFLKKGFSVLAKLVPPSRKNKIGEKALLARRFISLMGLSEEKRHNRIMSFIDKDVQKDLLESSLEEGEDLLVEISNAFKNEPKVNKALYTDFISYLPGDLLTKEDRATMAVSLEGRVPFLDHRLAEYSFELDPELKVKGLTPKYILKKAFEDILPKDILYREKHGFAFPISEHLREDLKDMAKDILFSGSHDLFKKDALENMFKAHIDGEDFGQQIWSLMVFNLWYDKQR